MAGIDWEAVARAEVHPLRVRVMEHAAADPGRRFSSVDLAREWPDEKLGNLSYHVRELHGDGLLARAGHRTVRGAVQRYYRAGARLLA